MNLKELKKLCDELLVAVYKRTTQGHSEICAAPEFECDCGHDQLVEGLTPARTYLPKLIAVAKAARDVVEWAPEYSGGLRQALAALESE